MAEIIPLMAPQSETRRISPAQSSQSKQPKISVVMVSYFTGPALTGAIKAVLADPDITEIILIDNGNSIYMRERLYEIKRNEARLRILQGHGNIGFARACNYGTKFIQSDYILFLNPDTIIEKGAASLLAKCGENLQEPWLAGGYLYDVEGQEQKGARRQDLTLWRAIVSFSPLGVFLKNTNLHLNQTPMPKENMPMSTVSGACMMCSRLGFKQLGGFDERYFLHVEDIDICRQANFLGGQVYFVPKAKVLHFGATSQVIPIIVEYQKFKSVTKYFWKHAYSVRHKLMTLLAIPFIGGALIVRTFVNLWR